MLLEVTQQGCLHGNHQAGDCDVLNAHPGLHRTQAHYRQHLDTVLQPINLPLSFFTLRAVAGQTLVRVPDMLYPTPQFYGGKNEPHRTHKTDPSGSAGS